MKPDQSSKSRHPDDYRLVVFRKLFRALKTCKSFMSQKLTSKLKHYTLALQSNPNNQNALKCSKKFEGKLNFLKRIQSKELRMAAFVFCQFDLDLELDKLEDSKEPLIEGDKSEFIEQVYAQIQDSKLAKQDYLLYYELIKSKGPKIFQSEMAGCRKLISTVKDRKLAKKIKKKNQIHRKLEAKKQGAVAGDESGDESGDEAQLEKLEGEISTAQNEKLSGLVGKFLAKSKVDVAKFAFGEADLEEEEEKEKRPAGKFPRPQKKIEKTPHQGPQKPQHQANQPSTRTYINKKMDKKRKEYEEKERKRGVRPQTPQVPKAYQAPATPKFHPSYLAKKLAREDQKKPVNMAKAVELD